MGTALRNQISPAATRRWVAARALALTAVAAGVALGAADPASAGVTFKLKGRGYGHGIGLSQYGAYGYAQHGRGAGWIVRHYYPGTKLGEAGTKRIRVLITTGIGSASFTNARKACGRNVSAAKTYSAVASGGRVKLFAGNKKIASCGGALTASGKGGVRIAGHGTYRGKSIFRLGGGALDIINRLKLEAYLKGVVPVEMPASWHRQALRAQAIVARSYALATSVDGDGFDVYDDTRSQVYGGKSVEVGSTNRAVTKTSGRVVRYGGKVAVTYFYSTSGGRTESIEHAWPGASPVPYLKSVRDEFDSISPYHRWSETMSRRELQSRLGSWVKGRLRNVRVAEKGDGGRIVRARIIGSSGRTTVTGPELRTRLGLRSTWVRFKRV